MCFLRARPTTGVGLTVVECTKCSMMSGHPVSTYIASVIDFNSPDGSRDENITEYNCSNCFHSFIITLPAVYSTVDIVQNIYDSPASRHGRGYGSRSFTLNTGSGYTHRTRGIGIRNNRRRKTAGIEDIKSKTQSTTSSSTCDLVEIDLELKEESDV